MLDRVTLSFSICEQSFPKHAVAFDNVFLLLLLLLTPHFLLSNNLLLFDYNKEKKLRQTIQHTDTTIKY